jgi:hypothetical protein
MIDFMTVSREFRGLVDRRREIFTFLGSAFAAMSVFLSNALEGKLPNSLEKLQENLFAFFALVLMVISLVLALRMARLHGGMVINGILYARLMQEQSFTRKGDLERAKRHNWFGVSFLQFVLVDAVAAFSTIILLLALNLAGTVAVGAGCGLFVLWQIFYQRFRAKGIRFAMKKISEEQAGPVCQEDWREHVSLCLQQANQGLLAELAFSGLMVFSCFGAMSGLGKIQTAKIDLGAALVQEHGPLFFGALMTLTCFLELVIYLRVRVAIGTFSLQLDPTDKPFRILRLTDSLLGYMLLAFLFCVSLHVTLLMAAPIFREHLPLVLIVDAAAFAICILAEQSTLLVAGRKSKSKTVQSNPTSS